MEFAQELKQVIGRNSASFVAVLDGYRAEEMIHRSNLCLLYQA